MTRIAVVGGGPGGGAAALALACGGVDVTLFHPARPGEKPCGGALPDYLLAELSDVDLSGVAAIRPGQVVVENANGSRCELEMDGLRIYRRQDFDAAIVTAAASAGASLVARKVVGLTEASRGIEVDTGSASEIFDWVIAADGARSVGRRLIGVPHPEESFGLGASLPGVHSDRLVLSFPSVADAYLWVFPRPDGVSVGVAYGSQKLSHGAAKGLLRDFLSRHLPESITARGRRYRYPIPVFSRRTPEDVAEAGARRVLLIGDAAGLADPLTREGIRPAIRSGLWAAECLLAGRGSDYASMLRSKMAAEMERATRAAALFYDEPVGQWMVPLSRIHPGIRAVLGDLLSCRQPYSGLRRRLVTAAFRPGSHSRAQVP